MADHDTSAYGDNIADEYDSLHPFLEATTGPGVDTLAALAGHGPVLELGVGTGRLAIPLAQRGLPVHGIDASESMLDRLRAKPGGDLVHCTRSDFAAFQLAERFSLIYIAFNTLFLLPSQEDQVRCFQAAARHLLPGGVLVVECFVPGFFRDSNFGVALLAARTDHLQLESSEVDLANQRITSQMISLSAAGLRVYPVALRFAYPCELDLMARLSGLRLRERWANWQRETFTSQSAAHVSVYVGGVQDNSSKHHDGGCPG